MKKDTKTICYGGLCLALIWLLPFVTFGVPEVANKFSPMHYPAFLCGFICGPIWGALVGFIGPITRSLLFGRPPMLQKAIPMAFELASYAAVSGILFKRLPKKKSSIYKALICAMIIGRLIWAPVKYFMMNKVVGTLFTLPMLLADGVLNAWVGIIAQIILIPIIVMALEKSKIIK